MKMIQKVNHASFLMPLHLYGILSKRKQKQNKSANAKNKIDAKNLKLKINQSHRIFH